MTKSVGMATRKRLVRSFWEKASGDIFEKYPDILQVVIAGRPGIYALYRRGNLYYVGLASNLMSRLRRHTRDRHKGKWDRFSVYITMSDRQTRELEALLLRIAPPAGNRQIGKLPGARNLSSQVLRQMRARDTATYESLIGGRAAETLRKRRVARTGSLAGLHDRRRTLRGWRKGWQYEATLLKSGQVKYDGESYASLGAAAKAATKARSIRGWAFWHYKDAGGDWVPLKKLKK